MIDNPHQTTVEKQSVWLLPQKALYWVEEKALILADLHIGKTGHFRRHGIPVPGTLNQTNLDILDLLVENLEPTKLIILGDLFHSGKNREWHQFEQWRDNHSGLDIFLVLGNHDILPAEIYHRSDIHLFKKMSVHPFLFIHDPGPPGSHSGEPADSSQNYLLGGHIHPAVQLKGKGRQSMKLPCFYFGQKKGILPAFGGFTGTHVIEPAPGDRVFAVADNRVVSIETD